LLVGPPSGASSPPFSPKRDRREEPQVLSARTRSQPVLTTLVGQRALASGGLWLRLTFGVRLG